MVKHCGNTQAKMQLETQTHSWPVKD